MEEIADHDVYKIEKSNLTFLGLLSFRDCLRVGIPNAIQTLQKAGIKIIMSTGDNKLTAKAIGYYIK